MEKYHFFIGNIFTDEDHIRILKKVQRKLIERYSLKEYHYNTVFFTNLIYLGYFDLETASLYMDKIVSHLLSSLTDKIDELNCNLNEFRLSYDNSFYQISLKFQDSNNYLEKIIVPYLYNNAILPVYSKKENILKPSINLLYYKESKVLDPLYEKDKKTAKDFIKIQIPQEKFKIDSLSLIKGLPTRLRAGHPSIHNQMNLVEISKYNFPFNKNKN